MTRALPFAHATVKDASRRLRRCPAGLLDRRSDAGTSQGWPNGDTRHSPDSLEGTRRETLMNRPLAVAFLVLLLAACGDGTTTTGPSPATPESSFLSGTWSGPVTLHREGLPDTTGTSTWTFVLMPGTSGTTFTTILTVA